MLEWPIREVGLHCTTHTRTSSNSSAYSLAMSHHRRQGCVWQHACAEPLPRTPPPPSPYPHPRSHPRPRISSNSHPIRCRARCTIGASSKPPVSYGSTRAPNCSIASTSPPQPPTPALPLSPPSPLHVFLLRPCRVRCNIGGSSRPQAECGSTRAPSCSIASTSPPASRPCSVLLPHTSLPPPPRAGRVATSP